MNNKAFSWSLMVLLAGVWGSSFILMKRGLDSFSSGEVAALRISIAFLVLSPTLLVHYKIDLRKYAWGLVLMGVTGNLIPAFLFTKAETLISSSLAGMLNALTPLFAVIVAYFWFGYRPGPKKITGLAVGLIAACFLMLFEKGENIFKNFGYGSMVLIATFLYAVSANAIKRYLSDINAIKATVWAFCFTGPVALTYLFGFTDFTTHVRQPGALQSLGYIAVLAFFGTAIAVILYNVLIKRAGVIFASSCTYLIPVFAIIWGIADHETIAPQQFMAMGAIILSVYLINRD